MLALKYVQPRIKNISGGLFANWMPTAPVDIGDFGVLRKGAFERLGSLRDYGVKLESDNVLAAQNELDYSDRMEMSVAAEADAAVSGNITGKVSITAKDRGAFLYHLSDVRHERPKNTRVFNQEVIEALASCGKNFPDDGVIITEVHIAANATIIISDDTEGMLQLKTSFQPAGQAFLSGAKGTITTSASTGSMFSFVGNTGTKALLRIVIPKVEPSTPPSGGSGAVARSIRVIKDWLQERRIGASQLRIFYDPSINTTVVTAGGHEETFHVSLEDVTAETMVATITEESSDEVDSEFDIDVEEQNFSSRYRSAAG